MRSITGENLKSLDVCGANLKCLEYLCHFPRQIIRLLSKQITEFLIGGTQNLFEEDRNTADKNNAFYIPSKMNQRGPMYHSNVINWPPVGASSFCCLAINSVCQVTSARVSGRYL